MSINEAMEDDGIRIDLETSKRHAALHEAALKGDWIKAEEIFEKHPGDVRAELSDVGDTVLHVAAEAGKIDFLKKLMVSKYMEQDDLKKTNKEDKTAFFIAVMLGDIKLAELMLEKNQDLAMIRAGGQMLPILAAAFLDHEKMVRYLYETTKGKLMEEDRIELLVTLIDKDMYDVALDMVRSFSELAVSRVKVHQKEDGKTEEIQEKVDQNKKGKKTEEIQENVDQNKKGKKTEEIGETALHALARKPLICYDFDKSKQGILKRYYYQR